MHLTDMCMMKIEYTGESADAMPFYMFLTKSGAVSESLTLATCRASCQGNALKLCLHQICPCRLCCP